MSASGPPLVSVIVPTYNRAVLLGATLRSILEQTFTDLELIVVSDGSTDDTRSTVAAFADPRVVFIEQPASGRPSVPRNRGLRAIRGSLVALCDDDDLWRQDKLARQVALMQGNPDLGLCYTNSVRLNGGNVGTKPRLRQGEYVRNFRQLVWHNYICNSSVVVRRSAFELVGAFDEDPTLCPFDDYEMWLRIAHEFPIAYIDEPLVLYRVHENNIVSRFPQRELVAIRVLRTVMQKIDGYRALFALSILARLGKHLLSALRGHAYRVR